MILRPMVVDQAYYEIQAALFLLCDHRHLDLLKI
jgi:hypothetical protein